MAKDKKSFLIYCDLIHTVKKLKKEDAGELLVHLLEYVNDLNPTTENMIVDIVFEPIKQQLKRDLESYDKILEERSINGRIGNLKRWNNDLYLLFEQKTIRLEEAENIANSRRASPPDTTVSPPFANIAVTVTDKVNVNGNDTITSTLAVIKFEDAVKICMFDKNWKEDVERVYKIDRNKIHFALTDFTNHCGTIGEKTDKSLKNFQKHFTNWVRIKKQYAI